MIALVDQSAARPGDRVRVYEAPPLRQAAGDTLRPGGLALTDRLLSLCALPPGARVLDVGCGTGVTVSHAISHYQARAAGLDLSAPLLREGRARDVVLPLVQAAGERLPLAPGSVDVVLAECSFSLMPDPDQALAEWRRVLRPAGTLAITDLYARQPAGAAALHRLPLASCLSGALPRHELEARLRARGFDVWLWEDHTAALNRLAAELIMAHGSLDSFWCCVLVGQPGCEPSPPVAVDQIERATASARPGYFLLMARALP